MDKICVNLYLSVHSYKLTYIYKHRCYMASISLSSKTGNIYDIIKRGNRYYKICFQTVKAQICQ